MSECIAFVSKKERSRAMSECIAFESHKHYTFPEHEDVESARCRQRRIEPGRRKRDMVS